MATAKKPTIKGLFAELLDEVDVPEPLQITDDITLPMPTRAQMIEYHAATTGDDRNRAIFGEHYDAICDLLGDQPNQVWNRFVDRVSDHFFGPGSNAVEGN